MVDTIRSPDGKYVWDFEKKDWILDSTSGEKISIDISDSAVSGDINTNMTTIINNPEDIANAIAKVLRGEANFETKSEIDAYDLVHKDTETKELCFEEETNLAKSAFLLGKYDDFVFHVFRAIKIGKKSENKYDYYAGGKVSSMYEDFGQMMSEAELYDDAIKLYEDAVKTVREDPSIRTFNHKQGYMQDLCFTVLNSGDTEKYWVLIEKYIEHCKTIDYPSSGAVIWGLIGAGMQAEKYFGVDDDRTKSYFERAKKAIYASPLHRYESAYVEVMGWPEELSERGYHNRPSKSEKPTSKQITRPRMTIMSCPHCEEDIELEKGSFGLYDCPHCNKDFKFEDDNNLKLGQQKVKNIKTTANNKPPLIPYLLESLLIVSCSAVLFVFLL